MYTCRVIAWLTNDTAYADQVTAVVCRHFDAAAQHSNVVDLYKSVGICCQRADRISAAKIMADGYICKYNIFHFRIIRCIIASEHCKQSGLTDAVTAVVWSVTLDRKPGDHMTGSVKRTVKNTFTGNEGILTAAASSDRCPVTAGKIDIIGEHIVPVHRIVLVFAYFFQLVCIWNPYLPRCFCRMDLPRSRNDRHTGNGHHQCQPGRKTPP